MVLLVAVVVKRVVAGEGQQHAEAWTQREEDLSRGVDPNLRGSESRAT